MILYIRIYRKINNIYLHNVDHCGNMIKIINKCARKNNMIKSDNDYIISDQFDVNVFPKESAL